MKAAIRGRQVFIQTLGAHGEIGHTSTLTIVRKRSNDCEPGTAKSTSNEWVEITMVLWSQHLFHAFWANRGVRWNRGNRTLPFPARLDTENRFPEWRHGHLVDAFDAAGEGNGSNYFMGKPGALFRAALYLNPHTTRRIHDPTGNTQAYCKAIYGGAAAYSLENALENDMFADPLFHAISP